MRTLQLSECKQVIGALSAPQIVALGASLIGGTFSAHFISYFDPFTTTIGMMSTAVGCTLLGNAFFPNLGPVIYASAGLAIGYLFSSPLTKVAAFVTGASATNIGALYFLS